MPFDRMFSHNKKDYHIIGDYASRDVDDSFNHEFGVCHTAHREVTGFTVDLIECWDPDPMEVDWDSLPEQVRDGLTRQIMEMVE
jgi:hypothetical protein